MFMTASQSHWSCSRALSHHHHHHHHWTPTKIPLGYSALSPSRGDPVAIIKQDQSLHTLQTDTDWIDVKKGGRNTEKGRVTGRRESQRGRKGEQRMERGTGRERRVYCLCWILWKPLSLLCYRILSEGSRSVFIWRQSKKTKRACLLPSVSNCKKKKKANWADNYPAILFCKWYPWHKIIYYQWMN